MNNSGIGIGDWSLDDSPIHGYISNVSVYDSVLSSSQISTHYTDGKL